MDVKIDMQLFDEIEAYLQARAADEDGEAARLLMRLEDLEIERTAQEYQLNGGEPVVHDFFEYAKSTTQTHADRIINRLKGFES